MDDFLIPRLSLSNHYDRITGYFSASTFVGAAEGFNGFINNKNPKYRIITGAKLIEDEKELLWSHEDLKNKKKVEHCINLEIEKMIEEAKKMGNESKDRLRNFSYLLKENILEMKVAIMVKKDTGNHIPHRIAEFHEKMGILSDGENSISFTGGVNESNRGWNKNGDSITIFCDWEDGDVLRVNDCKDDFKALWELNENDYSLGVAVYDLPSDSALKFIDTFPPLKPGEVGSYSEPTNEVSNNRPFRETVRWYDHQKEACDWFCDVKKANGKGIFEMATGSGKTWTAMKCIERLLGERRIDSCIITVPNSLMVQWESEMRNYLELKKDGGLIKILFEYSSKKKEHSNFEDMDGSGVIILVSHSMLKKYLTTLSYFEDDERLERTLLIIDEIHNIGSDKFREALRESKIQKIRDEGLEINDDNTDSIDISRELDEVSIEIDNQDWILKRIGFKLGLSATPWSHYDEDGQRNKFLIDNFTRLPKISDDFFDLEREWQKKLMKNGFTFGFGLKEGIEQNILAEFEYNYLNYEPTELEKEKYRKLIASGGKNEDGKESYLGRIRAAAVYKASERKIEEFIKQIQVGGKLESHPMDRTLIFVETREFGEKLQHKLLEVGLTNFNTYYMGDKYENLERFATGETNFLVSCHRLSEGIDIKTVNQIIIFSSSGSRLETIQRIGRSLRKDKDTMKKSLVIDFIYEDYQSDLERRDWLMNLSKTRKLEVK